MGKKDTVTPQSGGQMKQKSIASFFAASNCKPKAPGSSSAKAKSQPSKPESPGDKENQSDQCTARKSAAHAPAVGGSVDPPTAGRSTPADQQQKQQQAAAAIQTPPASTAAAAAAAAAPPLHPQQLKPSSKEKHAAAKQGGPARGGSKQQQCPNTSKQQKSVPCESADGHGAGAGAGGTRTKPLNDGAGAGAGAGAAIVGRHIKVFWPLDQAWYEGHIQAFDEDNNTHQISYEDGDEEWVDLIKERHQLLPAGGPGAAAAASRKRQRKAIVMSDSDDEDNDDEQQGDDGSDDDSDFQAGEEPADEDEVMEDLEQEGEVDEALSDSEEDELADDPQGTASGSKKRKKPASKAARKRSSTGALSTPGPAAAAGAAGAAGVPPSSAGHTPMDRFACAAKDTPKQGFPGFTPMVAPQHHGTPCAKLGLFGAPGGRSTAAAASSVHAGTAEGQTPGASPCPATPSVSALTPDSQKKAALQEALNVTPGVEGSGNKQETQFVLGVLASGGPEAARFAARMTERFDFLRPDKIRDKDGRRPSDPEYNPRTVRIPQGWFREKKITEAQQQWWSFKSSNFDSVLLFKVGKFYEMFEMDAFVGVDVLGLSFMKGDQPHAGFPEAAYHGMAEQLARAGYRVLVVEQTETPEMLKARNAARAPGAKVINVVDRQAVAVLSRGTLLDPEMVSAHPDAAYVLAVVEVADAGSGHDAPFIGVAALDAAAGQILVGSWRDDEVRLKLRTQLTGLRPVEVVLPRRASGAMSAVTSRLCRCGGSRGPAPALNELPASSADPDQATKALARHLPDDLLPPLLQQLQQQYQAAQGTTSGPTGAEETPPASAASRIAEAALGAVGLMVQFLTDNMLASALLPRARFQALHEEARGSDEPVAMELNGAALEGLEILENALGTTQGSLLGLLDHCCTPFGRRRLRRWLTRPLYRIREIANRQDAVEELMAGAAEAVSSARRALAGCGDLERCIARLGASVHAAAATAAAAGGGGGAKGSGAGSAGNGGGFGREAAHVVLYEDVAKRRVKVLVGAMKDLQALQQALEAFGKLPLISELLVALTDTSRWSDFQTKLEEMLQAAEWDKAEKLGVVRPSKAGVDPAYDEAKAAVEQVDQDLQTYLSSVRRELDCRSVMYISLNKDSHVLEVPEGACEAVPSKYFLISQRKGFKRYSSDRLKELVATRQAAEEERERVEAGVLAALERLFVSHHDLWCSAIEAVAVLDCLMALAGAALAADGQMCRPKLLEPAADGGSIFRASQLRHPAGVVASSGGGCFVPNNIQLGGGAPSFILLTGPNMGGKSTLLRQVCLAAVLAQVGALVPADSLELTPMDGCFVRMGARDSILTGQSTFYIEMAETAAMLSRATSRSLVALDELGRGTATLDGAAIAAAVLDHLVTSTHCCGLFATHYHQLSAEHAADTQVGIMHMACAVAEQDEVQDAAATAAADDGGGSGGGSTGDAPEERVAEVTFLYKLTPGACPKSYGTNVARLAGLPASVVTRAAQISAGREAACTAGSQQQQPRQLLLTPSSGKAPHMLQACDALNREDAAAGDDDAGQATPQQLLAQVCRHLTQLKQPAGVTDDSAAGCHKQVLQQLAALQQQAACCASSELAK